jgi:hypothetical protein
MPRKTSATAAKKILSQPAPVPEEYPAHAPMDRAVAEDPAAYLTDWAEPKPQRGGAAHKAARPSALLDTRVVYCGDNLDQLRKLPPACIDLIYIDPPFNSNRNYEVFWGETKEKRAFEDRHESTRAYIDYMRPRCVELARVLKKTGSFYYHCDWHASHYVKVMLDQIFGENNFINEIIWKRQSSHNDAKQGSKHLGRVHDSLFFYSGGREDYFFKHLYRPYDEDYVEKNYRHVEANTGRRYSLGDLGAPGNEAPEKGNPVYEFLGIKRSWRFSKERMEQLHKEGRIVQSKPGATPRQKRYLDEMPAFHSAVFGMTLARSKARPRRALAIQRKSRWRCSNASSKSAPTKTTSSSTPSAAAAPRSSPRRSSSASGSGSTSPPPPAA